MRTFTDFLKSMVPGSKKRRQKELGKQRSDAVNVAWNKEQKGIKDDWEQIDPGHFDKDPETGLPAWATKFSKQREVEREKRANLPQGERDAEDYSRMMQHGVPDFLKRHGKPAPKSGWTTPPSKISISSGDDIDSEAPTIGPRARATPSVNVEPPKSSFVDPDAGTQIRHGK